MDIRDTRKRLGMTQEQLAERLAVSVRTVQNWENGGVIPATSMRAIGRLLEATEGGRGLDAVIARLDRIIELLEMKGERDG